MAKQFKVLPFAVQVVLRVVGGSRAAGFQCFVTVDQAANIVAVYSLLAFQDHNMLESLSILLSELREGGQIP